MRVQMLLSDPDKFLKKDRINIRIMRKFGAGPVFLKKLGSGSGFIMILRYYNIYYNILVYSDVIIFQIY